MRASSLEYCLLALIENRQSSGYDLRKILTQTPMRHYSDSPGSIYPALQRLERRGWIKSSTDRASRRRRVAYRLTLKGATELNSWLATPVDQEQIAYRLDEVMLRLSFHHLLRDHASLAVFLASMARAAKLYAAMLKHFIRTSTAGYPAGALLALKGGLDGYQSLARWTLAESKKLKHPREGTIRRKRP